MASSLKLDTIKSLAGNEAITISEGGVPLLKVPAFRAQATATQNVTSSAYTKVDIDTVSETDCFDTHGWFDTNNKRYTPQIAGYYQFKGILSINGTSQTLQIAAIYKNGSRFGVSSVSRIAISSTMTLSVTELIYMNGSTDYVELYGLITATSGAQFALSSPLTSTLEGFLVRGA